MLDALLLTLVNLLIVEPAQAEFRDLLAARGAPEAVVRSIAGCLAGAPQALATLYAEAPLQGLVTAFRLWTGLTSYQAVLVEAVPACGPALEAAGGFLARPPG